MSRLKRLLASFLIYATFLTLILTACATEESIGPGDTDSRADAFVSSDSVAREEEESGPTPNATATREAYLASIPQWERAPIQTREAIRYQQNLRLDAEQQASEWIEYSQPNCDEYFGTARCILYIVELEAYEVCKFRPIGFITQSAMEPKGHYLLFFGDEDELPAGGYQWIASYGHQAYMDGAVLNIIDCWATKLTEHYRKYPDENPAR